jgi:hypothetical protein
MIRGLGAMLGRTIVYLDYQETLEAAMWHCCQIQGVPCPSPEEMEDPCSGSFFQAHMVGLGACGSDRFFQVYCTL